MDTIFNLIVKQPNNIFLIDGIGALSSALFLALIAKFEIFFGMPSRIAILLSITACFFAVYSLYGYFKIKNNWRNYLKVIGIVNLLYCLVTLGLVYYFYNSLTVMGRLYFIIEIVIILGVVFLEYKVVTAKAFD